MNDPSKRINVNLSSLLSLKAELLRKTEEVSKAKSTHLISNFVPKKKHEKSSIETTTEPTPKPSKFEEYEDSELLQKSKKVLEAKTRLYNKMMASGGKLNSDDNCLVLFNEKKQLTRPDYGDDSDSCDDIDQGNPNDDDDDGNWVEYTDCLGRTRKCLKDDLEFFKKKDVDLAETVAQRNEQNAPEPAAAWFVDTQGSSISVADSQENLLNDDDTMSMASKVSKIDEMRANWDRKEEENVQKDFVHYQDILFDEARTHGVGYYGFSTDDIERAKQQREFETTRAKTLEAQKQRESFRKSRENIIAERVKAAKNRQRARLGLPPVEDEPETPTQALYDKTEEEKRIAEEERVKLAKETEEKRLDEERKQFVRPWDKGKSGVRQDIDTEWTYKPEKEPYSQEQWNDMKRGERNKEFAPMKNVDSKSERNTKQFDNRGHYSKSENIEQNVFKKRPFVRRPISNDESIDVSYNHQERTRVEIPPPPTFDYYGPSAVKHRKTDRKNIPDLETSIEAGLRFLREQSDKSTPSTKMKWTSNADMK